MEKVNIWYVTDNAEGTKLARAIGDLGLTMKCLNEQDFRSANILETSINILIFDLVEKELPGVMELVRADRQWFNAVKFVILKKRQIRAAVNSAMNLLHVEFLSRPVNRREFILLLEKTVILERYREMMRIHCRDADGRIETFESLLNIQRNNFFETEKEKKVFEKIVEHEKHLREEQFHLNMAMKEFSFIRQRELFDMKNRIKAEEMLTELRRKELMDAQRVIQAQEEVINFSSRELDDANRIISAAERAAELGRQEALDLHEKLRHEQELARSLAEEIDRLNAEIASLKNSRRE